uniref:Uncharacterized protein n=1 Tax=Caenorhabditis japonica TaxID=281687 RepID=A0A8R1IR50_CAEJA
MEGHAVVLEFLRIRQHYPPVAVSHEPPPPPPLRIKTESIEDEDRNNPTTMLVRRSRKLVDRDGESKIRQSTNVQIYKTPYAKRIHSNDQSMSASEEIVRRLSDLNIVPLGDALANRKYWMMSKIVVVMPTICHQVHEIKSDGVDWQLQIRVSDTSASDVICLVATDLLNRIFGFTAQQCKKLFDAKKFHELHVKRAEAERKLMGFNRLDLLVWLEIPTELDKFPLVLDVKTISDALNIL